MLKEHEAGAKVEELCRRHQARHLVAAELAHIPASDGKRSSPHQRFPITGRPKL